MRLLLVFGALALASACSGPIPLKCDFTNCAGCCDSTGSCQLGQSTFACGAAGAACSICGANTVCTSGFCTGFSAGGGAGGGSGVGGGSTAGGGAGGGTSSGGGSGGGGAWWLTDGGFYNLPAAQAQYCQDFSQAFCDRAVRCGEASSAASCLQNVATTQQGMCLLEAYFAQPSIRDGRTSFDATAAQNCTTGERNAACGANVSVESCSAVFTGKVATGGACYGELYFSTDCTSSDYCDSSATCPGVCRPRKSVGSASSSNYFIVNECQAGLVEQSGVCVSPVAAGGSCAPPDGGFLTQTCVSSAYCTSSPGYRCSPFKDAGQSCTGAYECRSGLSCLGGVCTVRSNGGLGLPCQDSAGNSCPVDLRCVQRVCSPRAGLGGSCSNGLDCLGGLYCLGTSYSLDAGSLPGRCGNFPSVPDSCTATATPICLNGYCDAVQSRCTTWKTLGSACDPSSYQCDLTQAQLCDPVSRTCSRLKQQGDACDPAHSLCSYGLFCDRSNLRCAPTKANGQLCNSANTGECGLLSSCTNGVCTGTAGLCVDLTY